MIKWIVHPKRKIPSSYSHHKVKAYPHHFQKHTHWAETGHGSFKWISFTFGMQNMYQNVYFNIIVNYYYIELISLMCIHAPPLLQWTKTHLISEQAFLQNGNTLVNFKDKNVRCKLDMLRKTGLKCIKQQASGRFFSILM